MSKYVVGVPRILGEQVEVPVWPVRKEQVQGSRSPFAAPPPYLDKSPEHLHLPNVAFPTLVPCN